MEKVVEEESFEARPLGAGRWAWRLKTVAFVHGYV
jgi:hypothetical protein